MLALFAWPEWPTPLNPHTPSPELETNILITGERSNLDALVLIERDVVRSAVVERRGADR